jgi:hypothetical protein
MLRLAIVFLNFLTERKHTIQFQSQFEAVAKPTPRERIGSGKISPMTTQAPIEKLASLHRLGKGARRTWTPGCCEEEDIDANEGNHSLDSVRVLSVGHTYHMMLDSCFLEKKH